MECEEKKDLGNYENDDSTSTELKIENASGALPLDLLLGTKNETP